MKNFKIVLLTPLLAILTGCDEKAIEFATRMQEILNERTKLIETKIAAEQRANRELGTVFAESSRQRARTELQNEQTERSEVLSADYLEGRQPVSHWRKDIDEFRKLAGDSQATQLKAELDELAKYVSTLETLRIERDQIKAFQKVLATLKEKKSIAQELEFLKGFAKDTSTSFDKLVCDDAKKKLAAATTPEQKKEWEAFRKDKGCDAN